MTFFKFLEWKDNDFALGETFWSVVWSQKRVLASCWEMTKQDYCWWTQFKNVWWYNGIIIIIFFGTSTKQQVMFFWLITWSLFNLCAAKQQNAACLFLTWASTDRLLFSLDQSNLLHLLCSYYIVSASVDVGDCSIALVRKWDWLMIFGKVSADTQQNTVTNSKVHQVII